MNCQACQCQKQIDALRRRCLACNPDDDASMPHNRVRADEFTLSRPRPVDYDLTPSGQATNLAPEDEHRLRVAMSSLFGLPPLDLLLVQHLMAGGTLDAFGGVMDELVTAIRRYHGSVRQMVWARRESILRRLPMLSPVLRVNRAGGDGSTVASALDADPSSEKCRRTRENGATIAPRKPRDKSSRGKTERL